MVQHHDLPVFHYFNFVSPRQILVVIDEEFFDVNPFPPLLYVTTNGAGGMGGWGGAI